MSCGICWNAPGEAACSCAFLTCASCNAVYDKMHCPHCRRVLKSVAVKTHNVLESAACRGAGFVLIVVAFPWTPQVMQLIVGTFMTSACVVFVAHVCVIFVIIMSLVVRGLFLPVLRTLCP